MRLTCRRIGVVLGGGAPSRRSRLSRSRLLPPLLLALSLLVLAGVWSLLAGIGSRTPGAGRPTVEARPAGDGDDAIPPTAPAVAAARLPVVAPGQTERLVPPPGPRRLSARDELLRPHGPPLVGRVLRRADGSPLAGATVSAARGSVTRADDGGRFELEHVPEDVSQLLVRLGSKRFVAELPDPPRGPAALDLGVDTGWTVSGQVLGLDSAPLGGARVSVDGRHDTTGPDGRFVVRDVLAGAEAGREVQIEAVADGWARAVVVQQVPGWGRHLGPVVIALSPGGSIEGRVLDEAGLPLPGLVVQVLLQVVDGRLERAPTGLETTVGGGGWYRLDGVPVGRYLVRFGQRRATDEPSLPRGWVGRKRGTPQVRALPPGRQRPGAALAPLVRWEPDVRVRPGGVVPLDVRLQPPTVLSGGLTVPGGAEVWAGARLKTTVHVEFELASLWGASDTLVDGVRARVVSPAGRRSRVELTEPPLILDLGTGGHIDLVGLPPGQVTLEATPPHDDAGPVTRQELELLPAAVVEGVELPLRSPGEEPLSWRGGAGW